MKGKVERGRKQGYAERKKEEGKGRKAVAWGQRGQVEQNAGRVDSYARHSKEIYVPEA